MGPLFDVKSRLAMGYSWVLGRRLDVGLSAPVLFFSSMRILDPEQTIISEPQRATALEAMALYLRENPESTFEPLVQRLIDEKFANSKLITLLDSLEGAARESATTIDLALSEAGISLGSILQTIREKFTHLSVITLLDLLEGASLESPTVIDRALSAAELSQRSVLQTIRQLSPERLNDQDPSEKTPDLPKYAVVIEGPGFQDETNRFPTLIQAQITVEGIEVMRDMEPIPNSVELNGLDSPAQLLEATRIFIKELSGP